jgi:hypothetical protein
VGDEVHEAPTSRIDRRDLIKKSVAAGGLIWAAPTVLAGTAVAASGGVGACLDCPPGNLYGVKNDDDTNQELEEISGKATCIPTPGQDPPAHLKNGVCFIGKGLTWSYGGHSAAGHTHNWVLSPALQFCMAGAKGAGKAAEGACDDASVVVQPNTPSAGFTTVLVTHPTMSHSEIIFCLRGTKPQSCP